MSQTLIGLYESSSTAQDVVNALVNAGFDRANIVVDPSSDATTTTTTTSSQSSGGGVGGFLDRLFGIDVPEEEARVYADRVSSGNYAVTVTVNDADVDYAEDIMSDYNPIDISSDLTTVRTSSSTTVNTGATIDTSNRADFDASARTLNAGDNERLEVVEEELNVGKRQVEGGRVRLRTYVTERPVEATVRLREEHVTVQRNPVDRTATSADFDTFQEGTIEMTEMHEEAVIGKTARVVEEVVIGKEATEREETVRDTVRRKDVEVDSTVTDVDSSSDTTYTTGSSSTTDTSYRSNT